MGPKVLIIEDDAVTARAYELLLFAQRCEVQHAAEFKTAMELCRGGWPEVVLLDIQLPMEDITGIGAWNGLDFLIWLRGMTTKPPPVFVISSHDEPSTRERVTLAGAAGFFAKPISKQGLIDAVFRSVNQASPGAFPDGSAPVQSTQNTHTAHWVLKEDQLEKPSSKWFSWLGALAGRR